MPKLSLELAPVSAFGGFWVSGGVHQAAQCDSPGEGQRKEQIRPLANSPIISAVKYWKVLLFLSTSKYLSCLSHISSPCSFLVKQTAHCRALLLIPDLHSSVWSTCFYRGCCLQLGYCPCEAECLYVPVLGKTLIKLKMEMPSKRTPHMSYHTVIPEFL